MRRGVSKRLKLTLAALLYHSGITRLLLHLRRKQPLILRYHRIYSEDESPFYELGIPGSVFEDQLDYLRGNFEVVGLDRVYDGLFADRPLPERAVAVTFDDGYRDNYTRAYPALKVRQLTATFFVSVDNIDQKKPFWWDRLAAAVCHAPRGHLIVTIDRGEERFHLDGLESRRRLFDRLREAIKMMPQPVAGEKLVQLEALLGVEESENTEPIMDWNEIREMSREGFEIGSHGLDHSILSWLSPRETERQVVESRRRLEARLAKQVSFFSYPNGKIEDVTENVEQTVIRAGYRGAVATVEGRVNRRSDPFFVCRKGVSLGMTTDARGLFSEVLFETELSGIFDFLFFRKRRGRALH